jgi:hypothetical protein
MVDSNTLRDVAWYFSGFVSPLILWRFASAYDAGWDTEKMYWPSPIILVACAAASVFGMYTALVCLCTSAPMLIIVGAEVLENKHSTVTRLTRWVFSTVTRLTRWVFSPVFATKEKRRQYEAEKERRRNNEVF